MLLCAAFIISNIFTLIYYFDILGVIVVFMCFNAFMFNLSNCLLKTYSITFSPRVNTKSVLFSLLGYELKQIKCYLSKPYLL